MPPVRKNLGMNRYQASITHLEDTRKLSQIGKRKLLGKINQTGDAQYLNMRLSGTLAILLLDPKKG